MPDMLVEDTEEEDDSDDEEETQQDEGNEVGDALTGPAGVWRKTRYGNWVLVSQI